MIKKNNYRRVHDQVRKWGMRNKEEIFKAFNGKCADCDATENLTIHHLKYEIGIANVKVLCNDCHRKFHDLEMKKKMMIYLLGDFKRQNVPNSMTIGEYKHQLFERINSIPIEIVTGLRFDGIPDFMMEM